MKLSFWWHKRILGHYITTQRGYVGSNGGYWVTTTACSCNRLVRKTV